MKLRCNDTSTGVQRLHKALELHGVHCIMDQDVKALLKLGMGRNPSVALFFETVTADEILTVLQQLSSEDRGADVRHRGRSVFDILVLNTMTREDQKTVPWELGIDSAQLDAPMPKQQVRPDSRKPLSKVAPNEGAERLKGQGGPQTGTG